MDIDTISEKIVAGDRRALSRAITLIESSRKDHREQAALLMERLKGAERQAIRIGMSGTPGVGKSTFIESFGTMLTAQGLRVAVLAVVVKLLARLVYSTVLLRVAGDITSPCR